MTQRHISTTTNLSTFNFQAALKCKVHPKSLNFQTAKQFQRNLQSRIAFAKSEGNSTCTTKRWSLSKTQSIHLMCQKSRKHRDLSLATSMHHQTQLWQLMNARKPNQVRAINKKIFPLYQVTDQLEMRVMILNLPTLSRAKVKQASHNEARKREDTTATLAYMKWKTPPARGTTPTSASTSLPKKKTFAAIRPRISTISKTYPFHQTQVVRTGRRIFKTWANSSKIISLLTESSCFATCLQGPQISKDRSSQRRIKI